MAIPTFNIKLVERHEIAPQVVHLKFEHDIADGFDYIPGQFITLHLMLPNEEKELKRSYSIAAAPHTSPYIEFAASYVEDGRASKLLFNMPVGESLVCSGPYGRLTLLDEDPKRYILIATGTGVTPYRCMLPEIAKRIEANNIQVKLMFGTRYQKDILFEQEFLAFAKAHPNFDYSVHLSRETNTLEPHQHKGYVQHAFEDIALNPEADVAYLCGNPLMVDEAFNLFKEAGFDNKTVKREKYISK